MDQQPETPTQRNERLDANARVIARLHDTDGRRVSIVVALLTELRIRPTVTSMMLASIFSGLCTMVLGAEASRAFIDLGGQHGGPYIARFMGAALFFGGLLNLAGIARLGSFIELMGLSLISAGTFVYSGAVFLGLHQNGVVAGGLSAGLSIGAALRVVLLVRAAKRLHKDLLD